MGFAKWYDENVLPSLIVGAGTSAPILKRRELVVPRARGDVFELGCGGGINMRYYDQQSVSRLCGIDPNPSLLDLARNEAQERGFTAELREGMGEAIPFRDNSFDSAVCTFTLCSVENHSQVLRELRRILRPGGSVLFLEHGRAPDRRVLKWQNIAEPLWKRVAGGCRLTRLIGAAFRGTGFEVEPLGQGYLPKTPRLLGWTEWGIARKSGL